MAYTWTSEIKDYADGKYRVKVIYTESINSVAVYAAIVSVKSFKKEQKVKFEWNSLAGGGYDQKSIVKTQVGAAADFTTNAKSVNLRVTVGNDQGTDSGGDVTVVPTYHSSSLCPAPTGVKSKRLTNTHQQITITADCAGYNVTSYVIERKQDNGSYSELETVNVTWSSDGVSAIYDDYTTTEDHQYTWRVKLQTSEESSEWVTSNSQTTQPETHESITVEQETLLGQKLNKVKWAKDTTPSSTQGWLVQYEENGSGRWITFAVVIKLSLVYNYFALHYPSKGKTYRYRLLAFAKTGYNIEDIPIIGKALDDIPLLGDLPILQIATTAGQASDSYITEPTAPTSINAYRAQDGITAVVEVNDNSSNTAENVHIMRSGDGGGWSEVATLDYSTHTTWIDEEAGDYARLQYRANFSNTVGFSSYKESNVVEMLSIPEAPYLGEPFDGIKLIIEDGSAVLAWRHRPTDGTPQTAAQLQWKKNNGTWNDVVLDSESSYTLGFGNFNANDVISWRVRTKGYYFADDPEQEWSTYSDTQTFTLLKKPQVQITYPVSMTIDTLPITVTWSYLDESGELEQLVLFILNDGDTVATYYLSGEDSSYTITDFLFDNNKSYELRLTALSTSGLSSTHGIGINVAYTPTSADGALIPSFYGDPETGYVNIITLMDTSDEQKDIVEAYIYRVHEKDRCLVGEVGDGVQLLDELAPLNVNYGYELLQLTSDGEIILTRYEYQLNSKYSFIYCDNEIFKGKWNPTFDTSFDRPERKEVRYSGRKFPVTHDSDAVSETGNYSTVITEREEYVKLKEMMRHSGQGIWKSADGDTYRANFKFNANTNRYDKTQKWHISLSVTRIEE